MAILSKIRDRSMFLILIVGLALFAFVLDPSSIQSFFSSNKVNSIGQVNGEEIDREEFAQQVENYKSQTGGRATQMQAINAVWNTMVSEKIFENQLKLAGIVVGEKDIWDAMVSLPEIQNSPMFRNEINLFDEEKLKEYIATLKDDADSGNKEPWLNWLATEKSIKQNLERQAYTSLVSAGLGASLKEGERDYFYTNTTMDVQYVIVPYTSVNDKDVEVTNDDLKSFLKKNSKKYKSEASRSIQFVKVDVVPSVEDEEEVKNSVASFINDREEYSSAAKSKVTVPGLKTATNYEVFLNENKSDLGFEDNFKFKSQFSPENAEAIFSTGNGEVVGPYKENGYYKISKVIETTQIPDSVKSSHILVSYAGANRSNSTVTKEAAKKTIDSIFALVKGSKEKFTEIANEINPDGTKGKGGEIGWVTQNQAFSASFDRDFANYIYKNRSGSVGVVETAFGYHIIRVDEQTAPKTAIKLATYALQIEASEVTENAIFEKAETVAFNLSEGKKLEDLAKENGLIVQASPNLKDLDENIPGLNSQRQIVTWAFESGREIGDSRRFDIEVNGKRGYVVAVVTEKIEKGDLPMTADVIAQIKPIILNKKKAAILTKKMKGASLEEVSKNNGVSISEVKQGSLANPNLPMVGNEPGVFGAMSTIKVGQISEPIEGVNGVFVIKVSERKLPVKVENYDTFRTKLANMLRGRTYQLYQVLQDVSDVQDNRAKFF